MSKADHRASAARISSLASAVGMIVAALGAAACGTERAFADDVPAAPAVTSDGMPGGVNAPGATELCATPPCAASPEQQAQPAGGLSGNADGRQSGGAGAVGADAGSAAACLDGATEPCGPAAEEGACRFGARACVGGAWGECVGAVLPGPRDCNSDADNDCDGQPDSAVDDVCRCTVMATQPCDEHPGLDGNGACRAGVQTCVLGADDATSDWGECSGAVPPQPIDSCETRGDDANCDGTPNGGCPCVEGETVPCGPETDLGICVRGTSTCTGGAFGACQGAVLPARRDCASSADNDCDGLPDDTVDGTCACVIGETRACGAHPGRDGNGPCRPGEQTCQAGPQGTSSAFGACLGAVGPAQSDSCAVLGDDADCSGEPNTGCQCVAGQGNQPCSAFPEASRCDLQGRCAPCVTNADCALVGGARNLCVSGVCTAPRCGDGIIQADRGETCDDGGTVSGDGCSKTCVAGFAPRGGTSFASTHMCAVLPSGAVSCWGLNTSGQLGNSSVSTSTALVNPVVGGQITSAIDIALMGNTTCVALMDGTVSCWGSGFGGRPVPVPGATGVTQLAGGDNLFCGRQTGGGVVCWGIDGLTNPLTGLSNIVQVARGDRHGCALREGGTLFCAGGNSEGEGGQGLLGDRFEDPTPATVFSGVVQVATGYRSTCVRTSAFGSVQCVGAGATAGSPTALPNANVEPVTVLNLGNAIKIAAGEQHMCSLTEDDAVKCWGLGLAVGNGDPEGSATPVTVALPGRAIDVGAGSFTSCALLEDSTTYCWGALASISASATPTLIELQ